MIKSLLKLNLSYRSDRFRRCVGFRINSSSFRLSIQGTHVSVDACFCTVCTLHVATNHELREDAGRFFLSSSTETEQLEVVRTRGRRTLHARGRALQPVKLDNAHGQAA